MGNQDVVENTNLQPTNHNGRTMTEYPVSLDTFKTYFMREAGLEYQPYPSYDEEAVYNTDNKVIAVVNYKPGVWTSLVDDNDVAPGTDEDKWELDEDETENLDSVILDADILRAMGEASFKFSVSLFPKNRQEIIFLYLTMFFLVYDRQAAASGMNGNSAAGPVIHRTVGKMSVTYMESTLYKSNPSYEFLSSNEYGKKAYNLMAPYLRGGVRFFAGANTGD